MRAFRIVLALAAAAIPCLALGCASLRDVQLQKCDCSAIVGGCAVAVKPDKQSYVLGEPVLITVHLLNASAADVQVPIELPFSCCWIEVDRPDGLVAPMTREGEQEVLKDGVVNLSSEATVRPGHELSLETYRLDKLFEMEDAGRYRVVVSRAIIPAGSSESIKVCGVVDIVERRK